MSAEGEGACSPCLEYLGRRNLQVFSSLEEFEEAKRRYPHPVWADEEDRPCRLGPDLGVLERARRNREGVAAAAGAYPCGEPWPSSRRGGRMDDRVANDLVEQLVSHLTPQGKEVLEEILGIEDALASGEITEEEADDRTEAPLERMDNLPSKDQDIIPRAMMLTGQEHAVAGQQAAQEAAEEAEKFRRYAAMIVRAGIGAGRREGAA